MRRLTTIIAFLVATTVSAQEIPNQADGTWRDGDFVWFDLVTDDTRAAKTFYGKLFGWEFSKGEEYSIIRSTGDYLGGIAYDPELDSAQDDARWIGSISVPNVDATVTAVPSAGGKVLVAPEDLAGRGRSAVIEDPQGGIVALLRTTSGDPALESVTTGDWVWVHLWTPDADASAQFYERALGYGRRGDLLQYHAATRARLVEFDWDDVAASWLPMALVPDLAQALARIEQLGGVVHFAPSPDFDNGKLALVADPTGGAFLLREGVE